jgi:hypothetical protein
VKYLIPEPRSVRTSPVRHRLVPLAVMFVLTSSLAQHAVASSAVAGLEADCSASPTFVLFWPHGHPAVKSLGFPSFPPPHVEVYRNNGHGNASFGNADFVGFVSATGGPVLRGPCKRVPYHAVTRHRNPWTTRSTSTEFACTTGTHVQVAKVSNVWQVRIVDQAGELVLEARVTPFGGTASYNRTYCVAGSQVPH